MTQSLLIALREALQCTALLFLIRAYLIAENRKQYFGPLIAGVVLALIAGLAAGFDPDLSKRLPSHEVWTYFRHLTEIALFYSGLLLVVLRPREPSGVLAGIGLFLLGFTIFFFEARSLGFVLLDTGLMEGNLMGSAFWGLGGLALGFLPLIFAPRWFDKLRIPRGLTAATLLISIGALKFAMGGLGEFEEPGVLIALQRGINTFLENASDHVRAALLIEHHPFLPVPFSGLLDFLFGERISMALMLVFITAPPIVALVDIFGRPSPLLHEVGVAAEKRLSLAFFRRELINQSVPVLVSLMVVIVLVHATNISLNPMYEPTPIPVRESSDKDVIRISVAGGTGDLSDGLLRKYVYFYGNKQIIFIAIMKPDGTVGLALDECEICNPAEWNKAAQGYAQRGEHLVCKYCMTPIATSTVNSPGGCNPIPIPFWMDSGQITIEMKDLIRVYNETKALQKKGTHL